MESNPSVVPVEPPPVREVAPNSVMRWLSLGWQDMRQAGGPSLIHGFIVALVSLVVIGVTMIFWQLLPGAVSGFVLVGPFLATGLYAISKQLGEGHHPKFKDVLGAWSQASRCLFNFGVLLILAGTAWVATSWGMFHFFVDAEITEPLDFLRYVVTQGDDLFLLWIILGGLGTAMAFAFTVISMPMLMDRDVTTRLALKTSLRAVGQNPVTMFWWAMAIMVVTGVSFATFMLGFVVLYPVLGHASWHVYRDVVDASELPPRMIAE